MVASKDKSYIIQEVSVAICYAAGIFFFAYMTIFSHTNKDLFGQLFYSFLGFLLSVFGKVISVEFSIHILKYFVSKIVSKFLFCFMVIFGYTLICYCYQYF